MIRSELDGEFAMVVYDKNAQSILAARDRYGVRPLFYGYNTKTRTIGFASEMKALHSIMEFVQPVNPWEMATIDLTIDPEDTSKAIVFSQYYNYEELTWTSVYNDVNCIHEKINELLTSAVSKRLHADRPVGFLLSGGLDSSLIVAIATKILGPDKVVCFSIGLPDSSDVIAAKKVVEFLGIKQHHIIPFTIEQGLDAINDVVEAIESYDITTIRASTPQLLMAKYIKENTDIRVLLSGEGSDEIHGSYRYFRDAPNYTEFHQETVRLLRELFMFDCLRTDRTMANSGLEVRVPFLDFVYVEFVMKIYPKLLMYADKQIEKQIVRDSFKGYLPDEILYRSKEAFSDAVSSPEQSWYKSIQKKVETIITDEELTNNPFIVNKPETKEALYFRRIFDRIYPNRDNVIAHYWLPRFQKEKVLDPSATVLKCY
jgi:asparagine synthase (glutamine-hydrolysing)